MSVGYTSFFFSFGPLSLKMGVEGIGKEKEVERLSLSL